MRRSRKFVSVDEVEQAHGPLLALDRRIAFHYLDLGLSASECGRRLHMSQSVVLRRLAACGIARRPSGGSPPRLDTEELRRTAFLYERVGLSLAAVARLEGIYPNAVRYRLRAAGVPLRPMGDSRRDSDEPGRLLRAAELVDRPRPLA
ncbi:MAG TPA: hypothetical protein VFX51_09705 [Solirubrobacteraceae bacterium]|nr:hypothetical protein [Solirubrobacteraceae bacterium]